jgi:hypothetical protein
MYVGAKRIGFSRVPPLKENPKLLFFPKRPCDALLTGHMCSRPWNLSAVTFLVGPYVSKIAGDRPDLGIVLQTNKK